VLAESDAHMLELTRYVVLNPVRAGVCSHAGQYRWSSYRATAGLAPAPRFLAHERVLDFFRGPGGPPEMHYARFVTADPARLIV